MAEVASWVMKRRKLLNSSSLCRGLSSRSYPVARAAVQRFRFKQKSMLEQLSQRPDQNSTENINDARKCIFKDVLCPIWLSYFAKNLLFPLVEKFWKAHIILYQFIYYIKFQWNIFIWQCKVWKRLHGKVLLSNEWMNFLMNEEQFLRALVLLQDLEYKMPEVGCAVKQSWEKKKLKYSINS